MAEDSVYIRCHRVPCPLSLPPTQKTLERYCRKEKAGALGERTSVHVSPNLSPWPAQLLGSRTDLALCPREKCHCHIHFTDGHAEAPSVSGCQAALSETLRQLHVG